MSKRQQISQAFENAAKTAHKKLLNVMASGIIGTDELTPEELELLKEVETMTPEERVEILKQVEADPYSHMP
jgi:DNA replication initiation complex subunit (GINS family)